MNITWCLNIFIVAQWWSFWLAYGLCMITTNTEATVDNCGKNQSFTFLFLEMAWFQISNYQTLPVKWGEKLVSTICGRQIDTSRPKPKRMPVNAASRRELSTSSWRNGILSFNITWFDSKNKVYYLSKKKNTCMLSRTASSFWIPFVSDEHRLIVAILQNSWAVAIASAIEQKRIVLYCHGMLPCDETAHPS